LYPNSAGLAKSIAKLFNLKEMFREVIIQIKEKDNLSYSDIFRKANLPIHNNIASYMLGNRAYPVNRLEKIFEVYDVKYKINEIPLKNKYSRKLPENNLIEQKKTLFQEILIQIMNRYKLPYLSILEEVGLPKTDRTVLNDYVLGTRKYNLKKIEKIFSHFGVEFILSDNLNKIFREVIIKIKEKNHFSNRALLRKANLPPHDNMPSYLLGSLPYPVNRLEKIFVAYNVKYKINEVPIKSKNKSKFYEKNIALQEKTLFAEIIIQIREKYKLTYKNILKETGLPETDSCSLIYYTSGKKTYPLNKLEKIFTCFGVEFILPDNDTADTQPKLNGEVEISN
jgi:transcriptional regulator with XRE-family HTH domain